MELESFLATALESPLHSAANTLPITRERIRSSSVPSHDSVVLEIIKDKARSGSGG
jgi:hypothetical protein